MICLALCGGVCQVRVRQIAIDICYAAGNSDLPNPYYACLWLRADDEGVYTLYSSSSISNSGSSNPIIGNSIVQGSGGSDSWDGDAGTDQANNKDVDPLFLTSTSPSEPPSSAGDFSLMVASPARDAGDNYLYEDVAQYLNTTSTDTDIRGYDRIINGTIDMGAYESDPLLLFLPAIIR